MENVQQEIFNEILEEVKQTNRLKKQIDYENTVITALNLCKQERFSNNLFQVTIKVFNSFLDIQDHLNPIHSYNDINSFQINNGYIYLLEIKVVEEILETLIHLNSEINVFITNTNKSVNKSTKFKTLSDHNMGFQIIVPFPSNKLNSYVEVKLLVPLVDINILPNIVLYKTYVDISYFLKIFEGPFLIKTLDKTEILKNISKLYFPSTESSSSDECFSDNVKLINSKTFIERLLKHSYYRCDLNVLKKLIKPDLEKIAFFNMQIGKYDFVKIQFDFKKRFYLYKEKICIM